MTNFKTAPCLLFDNKTTDFVGFKERHFRIKSCNEFNSHWSITRLSMKLATEQPNYGYSHCWESASSEYIAHPNLENVPQQHLDCLFISIREVTICHSDVIPSLCKNILQPVDFSRLFTEFFHRILQNIHVSFKAYILSSEVCRLRESSQPLFAISRCTEDIETQYCTTLYSTFNNITTSSQGMVSISITSNEWYYRSRLRKSNQNKQITWRQLQIVIHADGGLTVT